MHRNTHKIDDDVLGVLARAQIDGAQLRIVEQLDRKLYLRVAKVIELVGGKWSRKAKAHVFDEDAGPRIEDALVTGSVVDLKKTYQFFQTPADLADRLVGLSGLSRGAIGLEPSAGRGRIARAIHDAGADVVMCEIQEDLHACLSEFGVVIGSDFLELAPAKFLHVDAVVANPPFARGQDVAHVRQMARWLTDGGRIVSVMSPGWTFRESRPYADFRRWAEGMSAEWIELPEGTFAESGTNVRAGIFVANIGARARESRKTRK
jgi:hypothetical protein